MALLGGTAVLLLHLGSSAQPPAVPPPFAGPGIALAPIFTDHAVPTPPNSPTQLFRNSCAEDPTHNCTRPAVPQSRSSAVTSQLTYVGRSRYCSGLRQYPLSTASWSATRTQPVLP